MRKLIVTLLVLAALLVVGDRAAAWVAADRVEDRLADEGFTGVRVEAHGFPFLTQALRREFDDVEMRATSWQDGATRVVDLSANLQSVQVPGSGDPTAGTLDGQATVPFDEVVEAAGVPSLEVAPGAGGTARITRSLTVLGRRITVAAEAEIQSRGDIVRLRPRQIELADGSPLDDSLSRLVTDRVAVDYRIPDLPSGLRIDRVTVGADGIIVAVSGSGVRLRRL